MEQYGKRLDTGPPKVWPGSLCFFVFVDFRRFSAPAGAETRLDRQGLMRRAFYTKNQPLTSILRPIRGRFLFYLSLFPAVFQGRVSVPCRLIQTLCFCRAGSVDRILTIPGLSEKPLRRIVHQFGMGVLFITKELSPVTTPELDLQVLAIWMKHIIFQNTLRVGREVPHRSLYWEDVTKGPNNACQGLIFGATCAARTIPSI